MKILTKITAFMTAAAMSVCAAAIPAAAEKLPSGVSYENIGSEVESFFSAHENTAAGLAASVFDGDSVIYEGYFGYADKENGISVDSETVLEWGSITKLTVWISAMQLKEQGKLDLNADIRTYLPEGFLKNLKYDEPVTMLNLMNHNAGFEESYREMCTFNEKNILSLEDYLSKVQPRQVFRPGETTAYSNWGSALAGYIVERISGEHYYEYAQNHIFKPLGMENTAVNTDRSDNPYVMEKRREMKGYSSSGKPLKHGVSYFNIYPAGSCTSTLADITKFGQALLNRDERIMSKESFEEWFSPSYYYGSTKIPMNSHGLWNEFFSVNVVGHNGGTADCSSNFLLDIENNVGTAILTNQSGEMYFTSGLPELVFGVYDENAPLYDEPLHNFTGSGFYTQSRGVFVGPLKVMADLAVTILTPEAVESMPQYKGMAFVQNENNVQVISQEFIPVSAGKAILNIALLFSWVISALICIVILIVKLIKFMAKKPDKKPMGRWRVGMALLSPISAALTAALLLLITGLKINTVNATVISILTGLTAAVTLAMIIYGIANFGKKTAGLTESGKIARKIKFANISMIVGGFIIIFNVIYRQLFMFWLL